MFSQLAVVVYLSLVAAASPLVVRNSPISIPLVRRFNLTGGAKIAELDRARAQFFKTAQAKAKPASDAVVPVPVVNTAVTYTATVIATLFSCLQIFDEVCIIPAQCRQPSHGVYVYSSACRDQTF